MSQPTRGRDHLPLARGWALWQHFRLRSAGFPVDRVVDLEVPRLGAAGDRLLTLEARRGGTADRALERAATDCEALWPEALVESSRALRQVWEEPALREALIWQNRAAAQVVLRRLDERPVGAQDKRTRRAERLLALYLQRYATKNDTVGHYGPGGFGRFGSRCGGSRKGVRQRPGPELRGPRALHLEAWAAATIAESLSRDVDLGPHLPLRLVAGCRLDGGTLRGGTREGGRGGETALEATEVEILSRVDGRTSRDAIRRSLHQEGVCRSLGEADIYLDNFISWGWLTTTAQVPLDTAPEAALEQLARGVAEPGARRRVRRRIAAVLRARDALAEAAGDPDRVATGLEKLESVFERTTGRPATRHAGWTYGARSLVWESCLRDVEVEVGEAVIARLRRPLGMVLESARWFSWQVATQVEALCDRLYERMLVRDANASVGLPRMLQALDPYLATMSPPLVAEVGRELRSRWTRLFGLDRPTTAERPRLHLSSDRLARRVAREFSAPGPGWPGARHVAPDVLIAARSPRAAARGEVELVLGEIHPGINPFNVPLVMALGEGVPGLLDELRGSFTRDVGRPTVGAVPDPPYTLCAHDAFLDPHGCHLDVGGPYASWRPDDQRLDAADLSVERRDGRLWAVHADGRRRYLLLEILERPVKVRAATHFGLVESVAHCPRTTIDDLVVVRERWRLEREALAFARRRDAYQRWLGARRLFQQRGLPHRVFVRSPLEPKPVFVSLDAPHLVEVLCHLARPAPYLRVEEVLPGLEHTWLADAGGARYTSELRLICVDPQPFTAHRTDAI